MTGTAVYTLAAVLLGGPAVMLALLLSFLVALAPQAAAQPGTASPTVKVPEQQRAATLPRLAVRDAAKADPDDLGISGVAPDIVTVRVDLYSVEPGRAAPRALGSARPSAPYRARAPPAI